MSQYRKEVLLHGAREYRDDADRLFDDLKNGEAVSVLVVPAFEAKIPAEYRKVLGIGDRSAFIGSCIAKRTEAEKYPEQVGYNLTFPKLMKSLKEHDIAAEETATPARECLTRCLPRAARQFSA